MQRLQSRFVFWRSPAGTPRILADAFRGFPQSLQGIPGLTPQATASSFETFCNSLFSNNSPTRCHTAHAHTPSLFSIQTIRRNSSSLTTLSRDWIGTEITERRSDARSIPFVTRYNPLRYGAQITHPPGNCGHLTSGFPLAENVISLMGAVTAKSYSSTICSRHFFTCKLPLFRNASTISFHDNVCSNVIGLHCHQCSQCGIQHSFMRQTWTHVSYKIMRNHTLVPAIGQGEVMRRKQCLNFGGSQPYNP